MPEILPHPLEAPTARCAYCAQSRDAEHTRGCPIAQPHPLIATTLEFERRATTGSATELEKRAFFECISEFFEAHGARFVPEYTAALQVIARHHPDLFVRREQPDVFPTVLAGGVPLRLRFDRSEPYPNAAVLGSGLEGFRIPFTRGFGKVETGALQYIVGFTSSASMRVQRLREGTHPHYRGQDREYVRMVEGDIPLDHLQFVIVRLPWLCFPVALMTAQEVDDERTRHIMRLFCFGTGMQRGEAW